MERVDAALADVKARARMLAARPKGTGGESKLERFIAASEPMRTYFDMWVDGAPLSQLQPQAKKVLRWMADVGHDSDGRNAAWIRGHGNNPAFALRRGLQQRYTAQTGLTYADSDYLLGNPGWKPFEFRSDIRPIDHDALIQGPNYTDIWHFSAGIHNAHLRVSIPGMRDDMWAKTPAGPAQANIVGYEISTDEGYHALGLDMVNDIIMTEAGRHSAVALLRGEVEPMVREDGDWRLDLSRYLQAGRDLVKKRVVTEEKVDKLMRAREPIPFGCFLPRKISAWRETYYQAAKGTYHHMTKEQFVEWIRGREETDYALELYKLVYSKE